MTHGFILYPFLHVHAYLLYDMGQARNNLLCRPAPLSSLIAYRDFPLTCLSPYPAGTPTGTYDVDRGTPFVADCMHTCSTYILVGNNCYDDNYYILCDSPSGGAPVLVTPLPATLPAAGGLYGPFYEKIG